MFTKSYPTLALLAAITPLSAQDFLDPLVITATRSSTALGDVPYSGTYFSSEDFREYTVRTLPDALRYTPGVLVQKTAHGHGSPYIRGFTGRQNLFLIDGIRFNNSTFRSGPVQYWNTVDPFSLDHFELIRSQGSVLYGSDAAGGTLNAFTKSSGFEDEAEGQLFSRGSAYYEYRSNGQGSHIGRIESQTGIGGKFGLHLGISAKEFGDIEDSAVGLMRGTGYPEQAYDARFDWAISPQTTLTVVHQDLEQDAVSRWHSTINNRGWIHGDHVTTPGTFLGRDLDQDRSLSYIRLSHVDDSASAPVRRITATLSYQESSERELQTRTLVDRRLQYYEVDTLGFDLELESPLADGSLVYGLDYYRDSVDSTASRDTGAGFVFQQSNRPVGDDSTYELFGAYAQYIRPIGESFEITGGLRYTNAKADIGTFFNPTLGTDISTEDSWNDLSASLRATYSIDENRMFYGGISQAFRSPNLNDLTGNITSNTNITASGALGLEPENFITTELGYRQESETSGIALAVFYTDISDLIVPVPLSAAIGAPTVNRNSGDGHIYGVELEGFWKIAPQWTLSGFASWQESQIERLSFKDTALAIEGPTVQEPLSRVMPLNGSIALRWDHPAAPFWVEGRVLASATADRLTASDIADTQRFPTNGTPSYAVASIHAGYNPTENLQLTLGLENLLDDDYRNHGSGQNEPGTNAVVGVKYLW
jgi:hemoglobin/transferrin/lactoferrin receptor protein